MEMIEASRLVNRFLIDYANMVPEIVRIIDSEDINSINNRSSILSENIPTDYIKGLWFILLSDKTNLKKFGIIEEDGYKYFRARYVACVILKEYEEYFLV